MTRLSVNINKVATLRNARGGNIPDVLQFAIDCEKFGAQGITVHPRPDQRHIKFDDVYALKDLVNTEFNIEGYPSASFINLVLEILPDQVTLVPDAPDAITSNAGWNIKNNLAFLKDVVKEFKNKDIRVSLFVDADEEMASLAAETGTDRIELYTESYASNFFKDKNKAIKPYVTAAKAAQQVGLGVNAGHDLNLKNLSFLHKNIPQILEVSIGHAMISDALYFGIQNTIQMYLNQLGYYSK